MAEQVHGAGQLGFFCAVEVNGDVAERAEVVEGVLADGGQREALAADDEQVAQGEILRKLAVRVEKAVVGHIFGRLVFGKGDEHAVLEALPCQRTGTGELRLVNHGHGLPLIDKAGDEPGDKHRRRAGQEAAKQH